MLFVRIFLFYTKYEQKTTKKLSKKMLKNTQQFWVLLLKTKKKN